MPHTPLLRAFQRLAAEHRAAQRLGIPPAELRDERYSRAEFLKRAGVTGAVAVAGPTLLAKRAAAATAPRIAIVGGGISGLTAALELADAGVGATIYEASAHVGGRMHSDRSGYWADGQITEFCGELIDSGHETIRQLAKRFHLKKVDLLAAQPRGTADTYSFFGDYYPVDQADSDFDRIRPILDAQTEAAGYPTTWDSSTPTGRDLDRLSVYDWIERYVPGGHHRPLGRLLDVAYTGEYGADTRDQASLNLVYLLGFQPNNSGLSIFGESDERFHIDGGNEQLPQAIAEALGADAINLGWSMQSIRTNANGSVSMTFSTPGRTKTVTADQVILALPFAVLRNLDYAGAGFDARKQRAITQMGAGRNTKLQLQFSSRYWNTRGPWGKSNGNVYSDVGVPNTWDVTRGQDGASGILVEYSGGSVAAAFHPSTPYSNAATNPQVTAYAKSFLTSLEKVFPGISKKWTGKASLSTPFLDPLLNCSYSYWRVGQYTSFGGYEGVPQGNIHFAGEHTSQDFQGFMEGGANEGLRAADEVLAAIYSRRVGL
jgi:monoamine oxidase